MNRAAAQSDLDAAAAPFFTPTPPPPCALSSAATFNSAATCNLNNDASACFRSSSSSSDANNNATALACKRAAEENRTLVRSLCEQLEEARARGNALEAALAVGGLGCLYKLSSVESALSSSLKAPCFSTLEPTTK